MAEEKYFTVKLEIKAPNADFIDRMLDRMPGADRIYDSEIIDPDKAHLECRIRYDENWNGHGEHFVFENKWTNEESWGLDSAIPLISYEDGKRIVGKGDLLHYTALTKIRELMELDVPFYFSNK